MITSSAVPVAALELLIDQGFDATSVDELANAAGMSRSTFFRRFGSKENMVFADQEMIITHLQTVLGTSSAPTMQALTEAVSVVFDQYTANPPAAELRHQLLQEVPALRDRELVSTHRFERAFNDYLRAKGLFAAPGERSLRLGLSAALVSIHNDHLRTWLRDHAATGRDELAADVRRFLSRFADLISPEQAETAPGQRTTVVVSVINPGGDQQAVLDEVAQALKQVGGI